ncbi:MAG TPA: FAD-dependent oxidoreductase [Candidatus Nanoarchaeia archaeon]|nr:FAD-dependent oxidoreductase [Candidatus Nanoarchaeia archaeon]
MAKKVYDLIVLGGGTSALGGAIYAARFNMSVLVLTKQLTGLIATTHVVENYPGIKRATGPEFFDMFVEHARDYPDNIEIREEEITDVKKSDSKFTVKTTVGTYEGKTILYALGSSRRKLKVPGEAEFSSKGVSYCATCDGILFKNKIVIVVGGSDSAAKEALFLTQHAKKVYIVYRKEEIHPEPINMTRVEEKIRAGKIGIINNTNVVEIKGDKFVTGVVFDKPYKGSKEFKCDGVFVEIGAIPFSDFAKKLGAKLNEESEIIVDRHSTTNVPGLYAAGDVTDDKYKQVITGVAQGVAAAFEAFEYVERKKFK